MHIGLVVWEIWISFFSF